MPIVKTVDAFSDEAYGRIWNKWGHVIGPQVRIRLSPEDAEDMFRKREKRHFTREDGVLDGWYCAIEAGSHPDRMGGLYGYAIVVPAPPPKGESDGK